MRWAFRPTHASRVWLAGVLRDCLSHRTLVTPRDPAMHRQAQGGGQLNGRRQTGTYGAGIW